MCTLHHRSYTASFFNMPHTRRQAVDLVADQDAQLRAHAGGALGVALASSARDLSSPLPSRTQHRCVCV